MRNMSKLLLLTFGAATFLVTNQGFSAISNGKSTLSQIKDEKENGFVAFTGMVKKDKVRLRISPHTNGFIVRELPQGEFLSVIGETGDFYIVKPHDIVSGYIFKAFTSNSSVDGEKVNIRLFPDISSPILTKLNKGTTIKEKALTPCGKWIEIRLPEECKFYVSKDYIEHKGSIELYDRIEKQKNIAMDLIDKAVSFSLTELDKPLEQINLETIYHKISLAKGAEFVDIPGISDRIEQVLNDIQTSYLRKKEEEKSIANSINESLLKERPTSESNLSKHIRRKQQRLDSETIKTHEMQENNLFELWTAVQGLSISETSIEKFYERELEAKGCVLKGTIERYSYVVANAPGEFIVKNEKGHTTAFLYSTNEDLSKWSGKNVKMVAVPRNNHFFAFPAYFIHSVEEN
ncbi:MAG: hypothetical protein RR599_00765 [Victivallaceae bacterium]